jgi:hypothetical protein
MKNLILSLLLASATLSPVMGQEAAASATASLGLAERRGLKDYQEKILPDLKKKLDEAAGFEVTLEVAWETIARPGESQNYSAPDYWTNIYFAPLTDALKSIAKDDDGKAALKAKLKKVVIKHDAASAPASNYANGLSFENGELKINWTPYTNAGDIQDRAKAIVGLMEPKL